MPQRPHGANGDGSAWANGWTSRARRILHRVFSETICSDLQERVIEVGEESLWTLIFKMLESGSMSVSAFVLMNLATWRGCSENTSFPWPHRIDLARAGEHTSYHHQLWLVNTYIPERRQTTRSWKCTSIWPHPTFRSTLLLGHPSSWGVFSPKPYLWSHLQRRAWFHPCRSWLFIKMKRCQTSQRYKS